jgi:hypothetical protein
MGGISVLEKVAVGVTVARVRVGRLATGEGASSVDAARVEEAQPARNDSRKQPPIMAAFLQKF